MGAAPDIDIFSPVNLPYIEKAVKEANVAVTANQLLDAVSIYWVL